MARGVRWTNIPGRLSDKSKPCLDEKSQISPFISKWWLCNATVRFSDSDLRKKGVFCRVVLFPCNSEAFWHKHDKAHPSQTVTPLDPDPWKLATLNQMREENNISVLSQRSDKTMPCDRVCEAKWNLVSLNRAACMEVPVFAENVAEKCVCVCVCMGGCGCVCVPLTWLYVFF